MHRPFVYFAPVLFAIAAHKMTDPIGANANAPITRSASKYQIHGNRLCGLPFITAISNHRLGVKLGSSARISDLLNLLDDPVLLGPVPQRDEFRWKRFVCLLKMRPMIRQILPKVIPSSPHDLDRRRVQVKAAHLNTRACRRRPLQFCKAATDNPPNPIRPLGIVEFTSAP